METRFFSFETNYYMIRRRKCIGTLQVVNISDMALRPTLAATITSSWRQLFPAATALAVASVIGFVTRTSSSAVALFRGTSGESKAYISMEQ